MKSSSLIVNKIIKICCNIKEKLVESMFWKIFIGLGLYFQKISDKSMIIKFLSGDVDIYTNFSKTSLLAKTRLKIDDRIGKFNSSDSKIAEAIKNSIIVKFLGREILMLLYLILVFSLPFLPTILIAALSVFICAVYLLNVLLGKIKRGKPSVVGTLTFLFTIVYALSSITSFNRNKGVLIAIIIISFIAVSYTMISFIDNRRKLSAVINTLLVSGFFVSLYGIYQYFTGVQTDTSWVDTNAFETVKTRVFSFFDNPNVLGEYLIIITSLGVGMFWKEKNKYIKSAYFISVIVSALCLLMTSSRGSMIGLILALCIFVLVSEKRFILLGIMVLFALPLILPDTLAQRLASAISMNDTSSLYRKSIYQACFNMFQDYSLTGIGVGAFSLVYPTYALSAAYAFHAHNIYLQIALETGILGLSLFLGLIIFSVQKMYFGARKVDNDYKYLITMILGGFAGLLVQGLVDNIWYDYSMCIMFWLTIALGISAVKIGRGHEKN